MGEDCEHGKRAAGQEWQAFSARKNFVFPGIKIVDSPQTKNRGRGVMDRVT